MRYEDILEEMDRRNPGSAQALTEMMSQQRPQQGTPADHADDFPEDVIQATRQPRASRQEGPDATPTARGVDSGITYSNYMSGPGYVLPKGMAMLGEEPREETDQEFLVKKGALKIAGQDPHRTAFDRTVKDWQGWFDIMGGEATPDNPKFRRVYGEAFDRDLQKYQAEELGKRSQGMEQLVRQLNKRRPAYDQEGTPTPDATEADILKALGLKGMPGIKDPRDYQNGVPDAGMDTYKQQQKEAIRLQKEAMKEDKAQAAAKTKWVSDNTKKLNTAYSELKTTVTEKIAKWKTKLKEAEKHYKADKDGWDNYIQSYKDSIDRLENFKEKFADYLDSDRQAIAQGQAPVNWPQVKKYWSNAIIKYK